jgi:hypothetical protein
MQRFKIKMVLCQETPVFKRVNPTTHLRLTGVIRNLYFFHFFILTFARKFVFKQKIVYFR